MRFSPKKSALNRRLILPALPAIELAVFCQMYDLHFKFEEDRTKTAVAIENDRYSFGQNTHQVILRERDYVTFGSLLSQIRLSV